MGLGLSSAKTSLSIFILFLFFIQRDLTKRRENKARAELVGKTDKVNTLRQEIAENENQLNMAQVGMVVLNECYKLYMVYKSFIPPHKLVFHQLNFDKSLGIFYINPEIIRI